MPTLEDLQETVEAVDEAAERFIALLRKRGCTEEQMRLIDNYIHRKEEE